MRGDEDAENQRDRRDEQPEQDSGTASSVMRPPNSSFTRRQAADHEQDRPSSSQNASRNGIRTTQKMAFRMAVNATITATIATPNSNSAPSSIIGSMCGRTNPWRAASLTSGLRGN